MEFPRFLVAWAAPPYPVIPHPFPPAGMPVFAEFVTTKINP